MESRGRSPLLKRVFQRAVRVRDSEIRGLLWSATYFFCLLSGYYILRPVRDTMGLAGGVRNLPWLFLGTLGAMLVANPIFAALVTRFSRSRFIPLTYRFFILNLLVFFVLLRSLSSEAEAHVARVFYVWTSVFNLFAVSIFWAFMADLWRNEQAKRLFGFIGMGGTLGAIAGASVTAGLAGRLGPVPLLLVSAVLIEASVRAVQRLLKIFGPPVRGDASGQAEEVPRTGGALEGIRLVFRSTYLAGICVYVFLYTLTSTFLYFEQANIVSESVSEDGARTALFARIDLLVNVLTVLIQAFLTGRILALLGVGLTLALLPAVTGVGFAVLGSSPVLLVLVVFQVARKASNYALSRPAREVLYTVVDRESKYKAKSFMDTFVYRGGDALGAWAFGLLTAAGLGLSPIAFLAVPLTAVWAVVALSLGRRQRHLAVAGTGAAGSRGAPARRRARDDVS